MLGKECSLFTLTGNFIRDSFWYFLLLKNKIMSKFKEFGTFAEIRQTKG
jgi:hypothetical protein